MSKKALERYDRQFQPKPATPPVATETDPDAPPPEVQKYLVSLDSWPLLTREIEATSAEAAIEQWLTMHGIHHCEDTPEAVPVGEAGKARKREPDDYEEPAGMEPDQAPKRNNAALMALS